MQLLARSDSTAADLQARLAAFGDTTFASALRQQDAELAQRVRSTSATANSVQLDSLKNELRRRETIKQGIALLDLTRISVQNDAAIAFLATELDGKPYGGTAFGVTTSGLLVTNRHNVRSPITGRAATRLGLKYANTDVLLHAHVVAVAPDSTVDLALVQVDERGRYPIVAGVARTLGDLHAGSPVVTIGFPHALDTFHQAAALARQLRSPEGLACAALGFEEASRRPGLFRVAARSSMRMAGWSASYSAESRGVKASSHMRCLLRRSWGC